MVIRDTVPRGIMKEGLWNCNLGIEGMNYLMNYNKFKILFHGVRVGQIGIFWLPMG